MAFRIEYRPLGPAPVFDLNANVASSAWVQMIEPVPLSLRKLAVVGGSPDVVLDLDELRSWDGDIWAINGTAAWLAKHDIKATMVSVDPAPFPDWMFDGVESAIFASCVDPENFRRMAGKVRRFHLFEHDENGVRGGCTSALRTMVLGPMLGYSSVHYFGCSGSFDTDDHCSHDIKEDRQLIVRAGGVDYRTYPEFYVQSRELAQVCAGFGDIYHCRSRGLFRAMMDYPDTWEVVAVSDAEKEAIESESGQMGMYEKPYEG